MENGQTTSRTSHHKHVSILLKRYSLLQAYVAAEGDCEERGTAIFSAEEVHKIAILDIRLANCDRNGGNILVKRSQGKQTCQWQLIPIDHGYCLPATFADVSFEWMYWPQASHQVSDSEVQNCDNPVKRMEDKRLPIFLEGDALQWQFRFSKEVCCALGDDLNGSRVFPKTRCADNDLLSRHPSHLARQARLTLQL